MTSVEVPYSIAAALPTLSVMDITNDVQRAVAESGRGEGIAYIHAIPSATVIRIQERETGFFEDLECLLERVVPGDTPARARVVSALLGPRTEGVPFRGGSLCLGTWQRVLLFSLDVEHRTDWNLTLLG
ncbi:MAG TPA: YjbQ family protein [Gaiellaceae bacterium]|nr:YjbQ family protein [Gaiellaceae bacterium]